MPKIFSLGEIESVVNRLAAQIGAPDDLLPTYGYSADGARPHIECDLRGYHYVVVERGQETSRVTTRDFDELLYYVLEQVTFSLACRYELRHRIESQDFRRLLFHYQITLLAMLSSEWAEKEARKHEEVLQQHPYDDLAAIRVNLSEILRNQGLSAELAWEKACERYPLPKN